MRVLKIALVLVLVCLGFTGGYIAGWRVRDTRVTLTDRILHDLQGLYYKPVDASRLSTTGIDAMLASLKDPYTVYLPPRDAQLLNEETQAAYSGIGSTMEKRGQELVVIGVFPGSPAKAAGLKAGDVIVAVDGHPTTGTSIDVNVARIKGQEGTKVTLVVRHPGSKATVTYTLTRRRISIPLTTHRILKAGGVKVGYERLVEFSQGAGMDVRHDVAELQKHGARWIIVDLRYNPGGLLDEGIAVAGDFLKAGDTVVITRGLHSPREVLHASGGPVTTLPMVVLVNRYSASAAEIVTGALQDFHRATVIGTRTFGKGLVQTILTLPNKAELKLTTAIYLTPRGRDINKRGLTPDVYVTDNAKTVADEALQRALSFIATRP